MSHTAIVCREYGLPAVVGTGNAVSRLKTGQRIRVNGNQGQILILE
jgi:pyruvate,water dikinase